MAVMVERPDGVRIDVTNKPAILDLIEHINGELLFPRDNDSFEEEEEPDEYGIMTIGTHVITEIVDFELRGTGWRFIKAETLPDGKTRVVLGR